MTDLPQRVYSQQADIDRIESWVTQLPGEARVVVELADGVRVEGVVAVRPTVQQFRDANGGEGVNARARIDDARGQAHYLWLDGIVDVRRTDMMSGAASSK